MTAIAVRFLRLYLLLFACGCSASAFDLRATRPAPGAPFAIEFNATPGMFYSMEGSSNLTSWEILRTWRAPAADATWTDTESFMAPFRFYRVGDLSDRIVVEGRITSPDGRGIPDHCPFCDILVSSSLDGNITYTDAEGRFLLRTGVAATTTNLPFTLYLSKIGFRPHTVVVTNTVLPRLEVMTLAGPSNNDFSNRTVVSGMYTNAGDTALADVEQEEAGDEPSVWYSFTPPEDGTLRFTVDTTEFLPWIQVFKGQALESLEPVLRGSVSNWVEWRIEITQDLTVYAGEPLQIRVGALAHPTRGISGGPFEARSVFEPGFPLEVNNAQPNTGTVALDPPPDETGRYKPGTVVTVQALPAPSYSFLGWSGSVEAMSASISVTMDAAKSLAPHFLLANGSSSNAVVITNGYPAGEGWIEGNQQLWYSWTPSRLTPLRMGFTSTNFLHAAVYRRAETNLVYVAGTGVEIFGARLSGAQTE